MQVVYERLHPVQHNLKMVSACTIVCELNGTKRRQVRMVGNFTRELLALASWLTKISPNTIFEASAETRA